MARPKKIMAEGNPPSLYERELTAKDKVRVKNITTKPVHFSYGVIKPGEEGFANYSESCTFHAYIERVSDNG